MYASHIGFYFLLHFTTGSSSLCSLLDLVLPLSVCFSMEIKQVDCEPDTQPLWSSVFAFLAHTEVLLVLGKWHCYHPVQAWLAYLSVEGKVQANCHVCSVQKKCQGTEPTRPGFIRKVSHLVSKNSRLKREEMQMQVRWEEAVVLPVCEQFNLCVGLCCACTFLSPWINLISTCCLLASGAPKDQGSFRGINNGKLCDFLSCVVPQPPELWPLGNPLPVVVGRLAVTPSGIRQSKGWLCKFFFFFYTCSLITFPNNLQQKKLPPWDLAQ